MALRKRSAPASAADDVQSNDLVVWARLAMNGTLLASVRAKPDDTTVTLRDAIAKAIGEDGAIWLIVGCRILQDHETLAEVGFCHEHEESDEAVVDIVRCKAMPELAPPPAAPANLRLTLRWAWTGEVVAVVQPWPEENVADLRQLVAHRLGVTGDGPLQLLHNGRTLVGPLSLVEVGLPTGATIDVVQSEPRILITSSADGTARMWSAETGDHLRTFDHGEWLSAVALSADGKHLLSGAYDGTAKLWSVEHGYFLSTVRAHQRPILALAISPNGEFAATAAADNSAKLWSSLGEHTVPEFAGILVGHTDAVTAVAFSPSSEFIATASYDRTARIWNVQACSCLKVLQGHSLEVTTVSFSPDGEWLVTGSADHSARLWTVSSGLELRPLVAPDAAAPAVAAEAGDGSAEDAKPIASHRGAVTAAAVAPLAMATPMLVATAAADRSAAVWRADSAERLLTLAGHGDVVTAVSFSRDGQLLAAASGDTVKLWDTESGECQRTFHGHTDVVTSVLFTMRPQEVSAMSAADQAAA